MKTKKILRFYFSADSLNEAIDTIIINKACAMNGNGVEACERLCAVIGDKIQLERLWGYLDGVLSGFSEEERTTLSDYCARRPTVKSDDKAVKRAVVKFVRHARRIPDMREEISVLKNYYCLTRQ